MLMYNVIVIGPIRKFGRDVLKPINNGLFISLSWDFRYAQFANDGFELLEIWSKLLRKRKYSSVCHIGNIQL